MRFMKQYMIYYEVIVYDIISETPTSKERELVTAGRCDSWEDAVKSVKELQERFKRLKTHSADIYGYEKCGEVGLSINLGIFYVFHGWIGKEIE